MDMYITTKHSSSRNSKYVALFNIHYKKCSHRSSVTPQRVSECMERELQQMNLTDFNHKQLFIAKTRVNRIELIRASYIYLK